MGLWRADCALEQMLCIVLVVLLVVVLRFLYLTSECISATVCCAGSVYACARAAEYSTDVSSVKAIARGRIRARASPTTMPATNTTMLPNRDPAQNSPRLRYGFLFRQRKTSDEYIHFLFTNHCLNGICYVKCCII